MQECMPKEGKDGKKDKDQDGEDKDEDLDADYGADDKAVRRRRDAEYMYDDESMDMDKEQMSEEAQAEMMACMIPEDADVTTVTCFMDMQTAIMDAKAAVKAAYEEAMNAQVMAMWPECAAEIALDIYKVDMDSCKAQAKEAMKADDEVEDVEYDEDVQDDAEPMSKKKNGGKKDKADKLDEEAKAAREEMVDSCMAELGYQADCLEQIDSAFESLKGDDEDKEESEGQDKEESEDKPEMSEEDEKEA